MPCISVIVPVYKVEQYLHRCINSILSQTYTNFELILVDDGSPDNCGTICDSYAKIDARIHVIHQENGGLSAARNSGIEWALANSGSEYLTFIDSDDWVHPQYLETLLHTSLVYQVPVSICGFQRPERYEESEMHLFSIPASAEVMSAEELLVNHEWNFNYACGKLYPKRCFQTIRYPEGKNFEDTFTTYKILFAEQKVALINRGLYFYFKNNESITRAPWTPKELVILEGMRGQMEFYRRNGYHRALEKEEALYVNHYAYQLCRIRENTNDLRKNKYYLKKLKKEMLQLIHKNPEKYGFKKMPQCYEAAYPRLMRTYHFCGAVLRTVKNGGLSGLFDKLKERH